MRTILHSVFLLVCVVGPALADGGGSAPRSHAAAAIVDAGSLAEAGLRTWWRLHLPLTPAERVEAVHLVDEHLYALTDRKRLFAIRAESGHIHWQRSVGEPGDVFFPVTHALTGAEPGPVVITTAGWVALLDRETGKDIPFKDRQGWQRSRYSLEGPASAAAVADEKAFYVSLGDRRFGAYTLATGRPAWFSSAKAAGSTTPGMTPGRLLFVGDSGEFRMLSTETPLQVGLWQEHFGTAPLEPVMALTSDERTRLWPVSAQTRPLDPVFLDQNDLIFAGTDRFVYCVDPETGPINGRCRWKRRLSAAPTEGPAVVGDLVFQPDPRDGVVALERETGRPRWHVPSTQRLLARNDTEATLLGDASQLLIIDLGSGKLRNRVKIAGARFAPSNPRTDAVYMAGQAGEVVCIRDADAQPLRRSDLVATRPAAPATASAPTSEVAAEPAGAATEPGRPTSDGANVLQSSRF